MNRERDKKIEAIIDEHHWLSVMLKGAAWFLFILCIVAGVVGAILLKKQLNDNYIYGMAILVSSWALGILIFLLVYAVAEIIQLLHDIRKKVWVISSKMNKKEE